MEGFFNVHQYQVRKPRVSKIPGCGLCKLNKTCENPRMPPHGKGEKRIMFVGEAPSAREDLRNKTMIGAPATYLRNVVKKLGYDLDTDCVKINAVCCCAGDEDPNDKQIEGCRPMVMKEIEKFKPHVIIPLGDAALNSLIGAKLPKATGGIHKWRGWAIPDREYNAWICPTFHPSYIDYAKKKTPYVEKTFLADIKRALRLERKPLPQYADEAEGVTILRTYEQVAAYLEDLLANPPEFAAFDYEATGLKPHAPGHRIVSVAISTTDDTAYAFMFTNRIRKLFCRFLTDARIGKIASNMKFEEIWGRVQLGVKTANWAHDTMLGAHVLDNRPGITSLKFQAVVNYGVYDYDSHISHLLKSDADTSNGLNRIHEIPENDLLIYNGIDSMLEYRLAMDQMDNPAMTWDGYDLLHDGTEALADVEDNGMMVDIEYCLKQQKHLERRIAYMEEKIQRAPEIKEWKKAYRSKFNLDSDQQMADVLFNRLGYEAKIMTDNGNPSVSEEALEQLDIPVVKDIVQVRRLKKAHGTYIGNYIEESVDGILRPFFHLHLARTFRGSSSKINFQNQPVRIEEIKKLCRRAIVPRKGRMIGEIDYGGIEVKGATFYHKDPNMIAEILDPERDMHRDAAIDCFKLPPNEFTKDSRQVVKSGFVFAQFYGDYYANNARLLWSAMDGLKLTTRSGVPLRKHLASKGVKTYQQFEDHIRGVEKIFWGKRFKVYGQWKEDHYEEYLQNGFVDILSGFRCIALMGKNDAVNYPIQGVAFSCLLWALTKINRWLKDNNMNTMIIGQIHDSIVFDFDPAEVNAVLKKTIQVMTVDIRKHWKWINVPLEVDVELSPVDGSWYLKKDVIESECSCGMAWRYENKDRDAGLTIMECPVCGEREERYDKEKETV